MGIALLLKYFQYEGRFPTIEGLELLKKYIRSRERYYDSNENVPTDGIIGASLSELILETKDDGSAKINRINYELAVLQALRDGLRCKEIWVRESPIRQSSKTTICAYALRGVCACGSF